MHLRRNPDAPRELTWVVVAVGHVPTHWEPYLHPATLSVRPGRSRCARVHRPTSTPGRSRSR